MTRHEGDSDKMRITRRDTMRIGRRDFGSILNLVWLLAPGWFLLGATPASAQLQSESYRVASPSFTQGDSLASEHFLATLLPVGSVPVGGSAHFILAPVPIVVPPPRLPGDLNGDGVVDMVDVSILLHLVLGFRSATPSELLAGDVRPKPGTGGRAFGDGALHTDDLNWVFRRALNLETSP